MAAGLNKALSSSKYTPRATFHRQSPRLTVYLRLNDAPVPAIYGPSADDQRFA
jgi:hypothetical protein